MYEGLWKEVKMSGEVVMIDLDGIKYQAEWEVKKNFFEK